MIISPFKIKDLESVIDCAKEFCANYDDDEWWQEFWTTPSTYERIFTNTILGENFHTITAMEKDKCLGFIIGSPSDIVNDYEIRNHYVRSDSRGKRVGHYLKKSIENYAKFNGYLIIHSYVHPKNIPAVLLNEHSKWEKKAVTEEYIHFYKNLL